MLQGEKQMRVVPLGLGAALLALLALQTSSTKELKTMNVKRITPVLFVEEIEPCATFWTERFGFHKTAEVPEGDKLGFVILQKGNVELMYQSFASVEKDLPALSSVARKGPTFLYVEVDDLDAVISAVEGAEIYLPVRTTFYGAKEIGVKDPAGHFVTFAQFAAQPQH
jgi:uncharacterized glyoxalase superfamily protein PhnB